MRYEILTKHGKTPLPGGGFAWDKIETAIRRSRAEATVFAHLRSHEFPTATIVVRKLPSLDRVFVIHGQSA